MTIKTVSAVMKKIENRTRGETANMATVPAGYPRPPRVTRHIRIRAGLYYKQREEDVDTRFLKNR